MPRANRVTPFGTIEASPARGLLLGNRGILHDAAGRLGAARWRTPAWICCRLEYRGWRRPIMAPGTWTELFFLDEAVALAAGHRPCALCRRDGFRRFALAWAAARDGAVPRAPEIDRALHAARLAPASLRGGGVRRPQRAHAAAVRGLPDGAFVALPGRPPGEAWLVRGDRLLRWSHAGYDLDLPRPAGAAEVAVLTPEPTVRVLAAGYRPLLHPTAGDG